MAAYTHAARSHHREGPRAAHGTIVTDPVCGMKVDTRTAAHQYELNGTPYYFCNAGCLERFKADPNRYLNPAEHDDALPDAAEGAVWTCPMHPEVRRD